MMTQEEIEELQQQQSACEKRIYAYKLAIETNEENKEVLAVFKGRLLMAEARLSQIKDKLATNR